MKLYFSGVAGASEKEMLLEAGVTDVLVDQFDYPKVEYAFPVTALDSGAYQVFKKGRELDIDSYMKVVDSREWAFTVAPDVIGDAEGTWRNWTKVRHDPRMVPVWHWSPDIYLLERYLDERPIVGIGGLVQLMRTKDEQMLTDLKTLCEKWPQRFHIFGVNWLKAIEQLKNQVYSGDTSKFLDGGRYGHVIFRHAKTGHLQQCPAKILAKSDPRYEGMDRHSRIIECARNLMEFCLS